MLPRFTDALMRYRFDLTSNQLWRYKVGRLPRIVWFIVQRPDLAQALAEDARQLAEERKQPPCPN
jgi:hypothetical protein